MPAVSLIYLVSSQLLKNKANKTIYKIINLYLENYSSGFIKKSLFTVFNFK